jgi:Uma2 family endonuclease
MRTVPRVPPFDRPATYDDLVKLPDHMVAEIADGELHASPRPAARHAVAYARLGGALVPAFDRGGAGPGGWCILLEPELHMGRNVVVPDLAGWRRERMPVVPDVSFFTLPPDWVCEILSPSTASFDRVKKLAVYAGEGVSWAWLVDPIACTLEVLKLDHSRWTILAAHVGGEVVRAEPFDAVALELAALWGDISEGAPSSSA